MNHPPRRKSQIITRQLLFFLLYAGVFMSISVVSTYYVMINILEIPLEIARTTVFAMMNMFAIVNAYSFRSFRKLVLTRSPFANKYLFGASILSILATLAVIYTGLNKTFELVPIGTSEWIIAISTALIFMMVTDLVKFFNNKYGFIKNLVDKDNLENHH